MSRQETAWHTYQEKIHNNSSDSELDTDSEVDSFVRMLDRRAQEMSQEISSDDRDSDSVDSYSQEAENGERNEDAMEIDSSDTENGGGYADVQSPGSVDGHDGHPVEVGHGETDEDVQSPGSVDGHDGHPVQVGHGETDEDDRSPGSVDGHDCHPVEDGHGETDEDAWSPGSVDGHDGHPVEVGHGETDEDDRSPGTVDGHGAHPVEVGHGETDEGKEMDANIDKCKKRKLGPSNWKANIRKRSREKGHEYVGKGGRKKGKREQQARCQCKKTETRHCQDITEEQRKGIFHEMWDVLNWRQKRVKVREQVDKRPVNQKTKIGASRRNWSLFYFLKVDGVRKPVYKSMFLHTVGLREWTVRNWACEEDVEKVLGEPHRQSKHYTRSEEDRHFLRTEFLEKLPKLPSHYCRASSSRLYLEPIITTKSQLHQLYTDKCKQEGRKPLSKKVLCEELDKMNISIFHPRKDQCDTCVSHDVGNIDDAEYEKHRSDVEEARIEKEKDKEHVIGEEEEKTHMITVDLQSVLLAPRLQASAVYYRTKLCVHNFTMYDVRSREVVCYVWHEGEGGLTASEFASCIIDYLTEHQQYENYIIYSDGCTYQNRNVVLSNALSQFAKKYNKTVEQKILVRGHTQMEVDSVHSRIENKIKQREVIYCPADYLAIMESARKDNPYRVKYLSHEFFKDYTLVKTYSSIRPGKRVGDPTVTDVHALKYTGSKIEYKLMFSDDWKDLPRPRQVSRQSMTDDDVTPPQLYESPLKITDSKYRHLQQLKAVIPADYHAFYDELQTSA